MSQCLLLTPLSPIRRQWQCSSSQNAWSRSSMCSRNSLPQTTGVWGSTLCTPETPPPRLYLWPRSYLWPQPCLSLLSVHPCLDILLGDSFLDFCRTLEFLMRHLVHMASFSAQTNMHARNLAIVWAPNLLRWVYV